MRKLIGMVLLVVLPWTGAAFGQQEETLQVAKPPPPAVTKAKGLPGGEVEALFATDSAPELRAQALKHAVSLAMSGDAESEYLLGVLYRQGGDHPADGVERNVETARYWLEKCFELGDCPTMVMASLAELELEARNDKQAMQWAQAWIALEREVQKIRAAEGMVHGDKMHAEAYAAYLLSRCFERLKRSEADRLASAWFEEFLAERSNQMNQVLAYATIRARESERNWIDQIRRRNRNIFTMVHPEIPILALYQFRAAPQGGRVERVTLIEGLPSARKLRGMAAVIGRFESLPYASERPDAYRYGHIPIEFSDPRYGLQARPGNP